ncbi:MAG: hypothetical protein EOO89_22755, partial [Pedobacter sp.]
MKIQLFIAFTCFVLSSMLQKGESQNDPTSQPTSQPTNQPSTNQLQLTRANTDPNNISLGNPDLKPSFTNSLNVNYNSYKVLSNRSIYVYGSYSYTTNPIINSNTFNPTLNFRTYQSVNLKDKNSNNFYLYGGYNKKITKWELNIGVNINTDANVYYSYV